MSAALIESCPNCNSPLVVEYLPARVTIICASCRQRFTRDRLTARAKTSRKAIASLALGLAALFAMCLTGIPAIVMGILALRDIRRSQGRTRGHGLAVAGIVTGSLFGVVCMPISVAFMLPALQRIRNPPREYTDAAQIAGLLQKLPYHQPPARLTPIYGFEDPLSGMQQVIYADQPHQPNKVVFLSESAATNDFMRDIWERQVRGFWERGRKRTITVQESQTLYWTIAGRQVEVVRQVEVREASGVGGRRYVAYLQDHERLLAVMVCTEDRRTGDGTAANSRSLTEEEVREFFASIRLRQEPVR